jgi:hypothetical protein
VSLYKCKACSGQVRITYEEKLRLLSSETRSSSDLQAAGTVSKQVPYQR